MEQKKEYRIECRLSCVINVEASSEKEAREIILEEYYKNRQDELLLAAKEDFSLNGIDSVAIIDVQEVKEDEY